PWLFLRWAFEFNPSLLQFVVSPIDVVADKRHVHHCPDALFLTLGGKEHDPRFSFRHPQLDPALFLVEWLVGTDREPKLVGIKIQGAILIRDRDADEFYLFNHQ